MAVSANGNQTSVASSATSVNLLAPNTSRIGYSIYNESTSVMFVLIANSVAGTATTTASSSNYTVQIAPGGFFEAEVPSVYLGTINAVWAAANGFARVTEYN